MEGNDSFTYTFVDEPTEIAKDTNGELDGMYVSISKMAIKNFPQTDSLNAAVISTDAVYESIFIIDKSLFDMAISYGMTLVDLYSVLGSDAAEMGMYVSAGTPTETGTEFEILETFLAGGSKDFVLIMILPPNMLSEQSTKTINFEFSLATITDPLIYSLSTDSNTNEQYYSVTGSYIDVQEIKVPATHKDIPVKAIASSAFKNSAVTTLNLSEATNLTTIDSSAFYGCASLTSADLSKATNLTTINNSAFYNCTNLTSITIPESVTSIGSSAFYNCTGLTEINYNAIKVTSTNSNIFANAGTAVSGITVNVGANVTLILDSLFYGVSKVQTVNFANGSVCATIGKQAFMSCSNLTSINLPSSLTTIGNQAFYSTGLTAITIPEKVSSIGERAFGYCSALADMVVDSNNTTYTSANGAKAIIQSTNNTLIAGCKNTEIPSTVQAIGNYAFVGCTGLNSVTIPEGLTTVGNYAFSGCSALTSVNFNGTSSLTTIGNYAFENCSALPSIDLSGKNSLTTIGTYAFKNCNKFTNITIPASVTSIGSYAFNSCTKLTSVNISSLQDWLEISFGGLAFATKYSLFVNNQALTQITMPAG
ncbi:MAG: leucine-rich repeat domain-containing protein, partial [Clostridia bacterium]|nr:leucine-rich repeat domain-containing protein [Clostridia bacterium]